MTNTQQDESYWKKKQKQCLCGYLFKNSTTFINVQLLMWTSKIKRKTFLLVKPERLVLNNKQC